MLTSRGFWFFISTLTLLGLAVLIASTALTLLGLTLLGWFCGQWLLFQWRLARAASALHLRRSLRTARGEVTSLWARQHAEVCVTLHLKRRVTLPFLVMSDRVPALARLHAGSPEMDGALSQGETLRLTYEIACPAPGLLRYEGVKVQLADLQGFFTASLFVREPGTFRVLPPLAAKAAHPSFVKQHNALPLLGTHRHARPGSGSELLELRDYLPGDPPRHIAWKVSARRDRLMTREFESDVPIRCTLFVDVSSAVRVGVPGRTALTRLIEIAAAVAQANAAERDLTGLCLFDEQGVRTLLRPGRGSRHGPKLIGALTEAACLSPAGTATPLPELIRYAYGLAQDFYPDLLESDVNRVPFWLAWWAAQPYWTIPQPPLPRGPWWAAPWVWLRRRLRHSWLTRHNRRGWRFAPSYRRLYGRRKQLAALLSVRYGLAPGGLALLLEDDAACAEYLQRFLAEHQVAYPHPLLDDQGRYLYRAPAKAAVLARALLAAVTRGKDNELFVLCVDLLEADDELAPLERAVCLARARHHQVVLICPWPRAVPPPGSRATESRTAIDWTDPKVPLIDVLHQVSTAQLHQAYERLRRSFGRLGVTVICAESGATVDLILHRLQRLRVGQRGPR